MDPDAVIGPTLETARLILRPPSSEDLDPWAEFAADPEATEFLGGPVPREFAWRKLCTMAGSWVINGFAPFSVIEKATGRWVGRVGPWQPEGWPGTEVAWGLAREAWGKGYAIEAATASIDWAIEELGWVEITHAIEAGNVRSEAVARRLGARVLREAVLPPPLDVLAQVWGQTRDEWLARPR
jgi:RimJ/RimL family protein N-acetyltransferase